MPTFQRPTIENWVREQQCALGLVVILVYAACGRVSYGAKAKDG